YELLRRTSIPEPLRPVHREEASVGILEPRAEGEVVDQREQIVGLTSQLGRAGGDFCFQTLARSARIAQGGLQLRLARAQRALGLASTLPLVRSGHGALDRRPEPREAVLQDEIVDAGLQQR